MRNHLRTGEPRPRVAPPPLPGDEGAPSAGRRHVFRMPFGPHPLVEGDPRSGYRFRLWAPAEKHVELRLIPARGERRNVPCEKFDGWHCCTVEEARPGDRYLFRLDGQLEVPDPASRCNPDDVHGASLLIDPARFKWDEDWHGRPWDEAAIYELHVGCFTPEGTWEAAERKLHHLAGLGVTAIELMPVAEFSGRRGWGYDGVLPFAPEAAYGPPEALKHFIQSAHRLGLMVLLDVVYNHFGPDGNYLHVYAPQFFTARHETPWGGAIDFEGASGRTVREFFICNALYWIEEYRFDGLRLDAVHSIFDASQPHFLEELSRRMRAAAGEARHVHLILENVNNEAARLGPPGAPGLFDAQWNDDFHHAAHALLTGEHDGYYADFADCPVGHLVRCLGEGFSWQGEHSPYHGHPRGQPSAGLPPTAFVNFLQNHDQIGNRAHGERLTTLVGADRLRALVALQLLAPSPPLIFMGEELGAVTPFLYFCDYDGELADAVREGRRREFAAFERFADGGQGAEIPDPCAPSTFFASKLDWHAADDARQRAWLDLYSSLLAARARMVVPRLSRLVADDRRRRFAGERAFELCWRCADGSALLLRANLDDRESPPFPPLAASPFACVGPDASAPERLGPWSVRAWVLQGAEAEA